MNNDRPWAFQRRSDGCFVIGLGPFHSQPQCPDGGVAFYVNDFDLKVDEPWLMPQEFIIADDLSVLLPEEEQGTQIDIEWTEPSGASFAEIFSEVHDAIRHGKLEKAVPVVVEKGRFLRGRLIQQLSLLEKLPVAFRPYGFFDGERGFIGVTPERLFCLESGSVQTMALAGTARKEDETVFAVDEKEIREHEFVAGTLASTLSNIGMTKVHSRQVLDLGGLVHFQTLIEAELYRNLQPEEIIQRLHPTPALGTLPRTEATLNLLSDWRTRLGCPKEFGAPFGLLEQGVFDCLVAIRCIHWNEEEITVPAGCGVIDESRLVNEWRELRLKRDSVKEFFGF